MKKIIAGIMIALVMMAQVQAKSVFQQCMLIGTLHYDKSGHPIHFQQYPRGSWSKLGFFVSWDGEKFSWDKSYITIGGVDFKFKRFVVGNNGMQFALYTSPKDKDSYFLLSTNGGGVFGSGSISDRKENWFECQ